MAQAEETSCFDIVRGYDRKIINKILSQKKNVEMVKKVFRMRRGGGYWIWKPILIQHVLKNMSYGDVLVYADAGCTMLKKPRVINTEIEKVKKNKFGISHCDAEGGPRKDLIRMDVLSALVSDIDAYFSREYEFEANRLVICKTTNSVKFINKWASIAFKHPRWFTDDPSKIPNLPEFYEHRHDQAIYNCIAHEMKMPIIDCSVEKWLIATRYRN